jgi:hypothetical protein
MNVIMLACHKAGRSDCCCNCTQCIETAPTAAAAPAVGRRHQLLQLRVDCGGAVRRPHRLQAQTRAEHEPALTAHLLVSAGVQHKSAGRVLHLPGCM